MKKLIILFLLLNFSETWATDQAKDILFYEGNKYTLYTSSAINSPLEFFPQVSDKLFKMSDVISSGCWRQYTAEWSIEGGQLFLLKVTSCFKGDIDNKLVEELIQRKFVKGKLKADWVNGTFWGGRGESYWNAFDNEIKFSFQNGVLINTEQFKSTDCSFHDQDSLRKFIYSNINWEDLPNEYEDVSIEFKTNGLGKIIQADVRYGKGSVFEKEALRVLRMVPCWKTYTHTGEVFGWNDIEIIFKEENKKKYAH